MLRLVVIHQLILSLVVGPMLCCCTVARLSHNSEHPSVGAAQPVSKSRSCCGLAKQAQSDDSSKSRPPSPSNKSQCPCKVDTSKVVDFATPEVSSTGIGLVNCLSDYALPLLSHVDICRLLVGGIVAVLDRRDHTSFTSTFELLYAHHNLQC